MSLDWWDTTAPDGQAVAEFRISRDGRRDITGAVWQGDGAPKDVLICFGHGASGDRFQPPIAEMAATLAQCGYPVLSLDGPVHGLREVDGGGLQAFIPEFMRDGSVDDMAAEWHLAIDRIRKKIGGGKRALAYFGLSMGTLLGTQMLAERDDVCAAVLGLAGTSPEQPNGQASARAAAAIDAPLLFLMQMQDEMIQPAHAMALFDGFASADKRLHAYPGRHAYLAREEMEHALEFILSHAEGRARPRDIIEIADYGAQ